MAAAATPVEGRPGRFITLEGGEGTGKTTLAKALAERLRSLGIEPELTREPGGSPKAEAIREALLSGRIEPLGGFAEALMFSAARIDHVEARIRPALAAGRWVICDRFSDSTRAYQGSLGQLAPMVLHGLERVALAGVKPDLTLVLDLDPVIGLARARARRGEDAEDRFEREAATFHRRLRQAFLEIAAAEPERCVVIEADAMPGDVAARAWAAIRERLLMVADEAAGAAS